METIDRTPYDLTPYRDATRRDICSICLDHTSAGGCARPTSDPCPLETHLETIVEGVLSVRPTLKIAPYISALRRINCRHCREGENGECELRNLVDCAVDSYILRVVEVIEEVAEKLGHGHVNPAIRAAAH